MAKSIGTRRLIRIGYASLYNRKVTNSIQYIYRKVGKRKNDAHSFRWQPTYTSNEAEPEYVKKRLFSWVTRERGVEGDLPASRSEPGVNSKKLKRAGKYFWGYNSGGTRRMIDQSEDPEAIVLQTAKFYQTYINNRNISQKTDDLINDLLIRLKRAKGRDIGEVDYTPTIRSSDGVAAGSKEESLVFLAPHLHKHKGMKETAAEKAIVRTLKKTYGKFDVGTEGQIDVRAGTEEGKMIQAFLNKNANTMIGTLKGTDLGGGLDMTTTNLLTKGDVGKFWDEKSKRYTLDFLNKLDAGTKSISDATAKGRYSKLLKVLQEISREVNNPNSEVKLQGEVSRRFKGNKNNRADAKKAGEYLWSIPTGEGDVLIVRFTNLGDKIGVQGGLLPNVGDSLGVAAVSDYLGSGLSSITQGVIDSLNRKNQVMYDNIYMNMTNQTMEYGLHSVGGSTPYIPTFHTNIMSKGKFTEDLSSLVNEAFTSWYSTNSWTEQFDPRAKFNRNNQARQWAQDWIKKSAELSEQINEDAGKKWKQWYAKQIGKYGKGTTWQKPWSWRAPLSLRPFIMTSAQGQKQAIASEYAKMQTRSGKMMSYSRAMSLMFGTKSKDD
tara:strand:+ start:528 stop:2339 length:1812 start_codon:yes stop_codon:yes gene_type:complete